MPLSVTQPGLIVIGSGPAGVGAAEAFRKQRADVPVRILTADTDEPYQRPPLSKEFLRGDTDDVSMHPASWFAERDLDVTTGAPVDEIDVRARTVTAAGRRFDYTQLILACGASPTPLPVPGGELALQLRSLQDAGRLRARGYVQVPLGEPRRRMHAHVIGVAPQELLAQWRSLVGLVGVSGQDAHRDIGALLAEGRGADSSAAADHDQSGLGHHSGRTRCRIADTDPYPVICRRSASTRNATLGRRFGPHPIPSRRARAPRARGGQQRREVAEMLVERAQLLDRRARCRGEHRQC